MVRALTGGRREKKCVMLKFAKTVRAGHLVVRSGDRYIRAGKRSRHIVGVVQEEVVQRILTDRGLVTACLPRGIVVYGPVRVVREHR